MFVMAIISALLYVIMIVIATIEKEKNFSICGNDTFSNSNILLRY